MPADDVLGLIVLAVVSGLARGPVNYLDIALTAAIALAFTWFVATFGRRTVEKVMPHVHARISLAEGEFALALTLLFGLSLLAVYAGVAAIVGAFLAGLALGETVDHRVLGQNVYGIIVFMSMATTLLAPPLLKIAFRGVPGRGGADEEIVRLG